MKSLKFSKVSGLFLASLVIGCAISAAIMALGNSLIVNGQFMWINYIRISVFFLVVSNALTAVMFSHRYAEGKTAEFIFLLSSTLLMSMALGFILYSLLKAQFNFDKLDWYGFFENVVFNLDYIYYGISLGFWLVLVVVYCLFIDKNALNFIGGGGKLNQVEANLENSRWLTKEEINKMFKPTMYTQLGTLKKDGVPVAGELTKNGKDMKVAFNSPCHSIIIGSTGSGKTTTFVSPMIQMLGSTAAGSSMIITDPKGELFGLHSKFLKSRGYDVKVIDLRDTYSSYRWNPLDTVWDMYQDYLNAAKNVFLRKDSVKESGLKINGDEKEFEGLAEYYEFNNTAYSSKDKAIEAIKIYKKKRFDEVYEDLNDLCSVLIPVENEKDPMWEKGARSIVFAVLLAMLEDSEDERLGMTKDKFNFFNMTKILQSSVDDYKELKFYFKGRKKLSKALSLSKQVCDCAETTRASYMSIVYEKLTMFNDAGICALTSASDFSSTGLAERPTALFLKIPDEKDTRHNLAAIFILNIYKTLIKVASATEELTLPRNVYFIMDEFGNMPKIEKFDKFITVGRSRKIWFIMIIQSYAQLNNVYGETVAEIVKGNCGIKMFIGSNDANTCKEYSELCGNITVMTRSTSFSGNVEQSSSTQTQVRPLIYPSELQRLNHPGDIGHSIIVTFGNYPLKTYFTPSFKVNLYQIGKMDTSDTERFFDEKKLAYFPADRNKLIYESLNGGPEKTEEVKEDPVKSNQAEPTLGEQNTHKVEETNTLPETIDEAKEENVTSGEDNQSVETNTSSKEETTEAQTKPNADSALESLKEKYQLYKEHHKDATLQDYLAAAYEAKYGTKLEIEKSEEHQDSEKAFDTLKDKYHAFKEKNQNANLEDFFMAAYEAKYGTKLVKPTNRVQSDLNALSDGYAKYLEDNPDGTLEKYIMRMSMEKARIKRDETRRLKAEERKAHPELYPKKPRKRKPKVSKGDDDGEKK